MSRTLGTGSAAGALAPEFLVTPALLDAISLAGDHGGMVLGCSADNEPLSVSVLRPQPTRLVLVGGLYLAHQVALRAMATGAWVVIAAGLPPGSCSSEPLGKAPTGVAPRWCRCARWRKSSCRGLQRMPRCWSCTTAARYRRTCSHRDRHGKPPRTCCPICIPRPAARRSTRILYYSSGSPPSRPSSPLGYGDCRHR